ncbi:MAG TPA: hypothetical protein VKX28_24250 [Xanthobacteraceae bacterium]|nr:hypothetical protein [Xanthobacteraceae bacterium]
MVKEPRPPQPGAQPPDDPLDLLRALAQRRAPGEAVPASHDAMPPDEKLASLRALAANLDRQLRGPAPAEEPGPPPLAPLPARAPVPQGGDKRAMASEWQAFRDGLPPARALVPRIGVTQIVFVAIAVAVLVAAAIGTFVRHRGESAVVAGPIVPPSDQMTAPPPTMQEPPPPDLAAIRKEMADCDTAAAHDPDSFYFLIVPVLTTKTGNPDWHPAALQTVGDTYSLLGANDALDGIRNGSLRVRPGRYTFSALDTQSGMTYSWTSATGMSRLSRKRTGTGTVLKLGFDFSSGQIGPQWSTEFKLDRGNCYWIVPLVRE